MTLRMFLFVFVSVVYGNITFSRYDASSSVREESFASERAQESTNESLMLYRDISHTDADNKSFVRSTNGNILVSGNLLTLQNVSAQAINWWQRVRTPPIPPPHQKTAKMARYIVHRSDWAAVATKSTRKELIGKPFASLFSISDGTDSNFTGVPYLYLSSLDVSTHDLSIDNTAALSMSLAQTSFCRAHKFDPQSPLCARVMLAGRVTRVPLPSKEYKFAETALFSRHPEMIDWPRNHHFFVAKLDIEHVYVLDYFGGMATVSVPEYFAAYSHLST